MPFCSNDVVATEIFGLVQCRRRRERNAVVHSVMPGAHGAGGDGMNRNAEVRVLRIRFSVALVKSVAVDTYIIDGESHPFSHTIAQAERFISRGSAFAVAIDPRTRDHREFGTPPPGL